MPGAVGPHEAVAAAGERLTPCALRLPPVIGGNEESVYKDCATAAGDGVRVGAYWSETLPVLVVLASIGTGARLVATGLYKAAGSAVSDARSGGIGATSCLVSLWVGTGAGGRCSGMPPVLLSGALALLVLERGAAVAFVDVGDAMTVAVGATRTGLSGDTAAAFTPLAA